ncbi:MAG TPA: hypothetical protein VHK27_07725, partial [Gammaproteobacteria bacterium]|nr:hypothetical protein [Gammaproteobacteria bacterium]
SVSLYLPNWDDDALNRVIDDLTKTDDAVPATIERGENLISYGRAPQLDELFVAASQLPTYPSKRANKSSNVKRLMQLARYLANDEIVDDALEKSRELLLNTLEVNRQRMSAHMNRLVSSIQGADLVETRITIGVPAGDVDKRNGGGTESVVWSLQLVEQDIREIFNEVGRRLGAGLHVEYVARRTSGGEDRPSATVARAELCALMNDKETRDELEKIAGLTIRDWWKSTHVARQGLSAERRADYARVNRMALAPEPEKLDLPAKITMNRGSKAWAKHLYADARGEIYLSPTLNHWEELVLGEEFKRSDFKGWLRNPVRKEWSLGVPYYDTGISGVMYPDFLIFRSGGGNGIVVDLIEPHAPNQSDLAPKLQGMCKFADQHGDSFDRVEVIVVEGPREKEILLRIDVNNPDVRDKARLLTEANQVVALARELAK